MEVAYRPLLEENERFVRNVYHSEFLRSVTLPLSRQLLLWEPNAWTSTLYTSAPATTAGPKSVPQLKRPSSLWLHLSCGFRRG